ncbi:hypothetical protein AHAT_08970 [Agarivorans sp. Toyoura001]|uniref:hypothetical protein n=1 Tax=Agarivorans sp. Toyoura001 TaxID=2283141 RepID=UPI0010E4182E|nr:hypothetical protein [Agarivorans sp. Toyoura001]GDY25007.1 hypothetical protein AHAT_08970 [Agarivorans sp. Toyoura001]
MNTSQHSGQGYQHRDNLFIDAPLLTFIEQQLLANSSVASSQFFEALSVLVEEFGGTYRRLNQNNNEMACEDHLQQCQKSTQAPTSINISRGSSKAILDEYSCAIPSCILDVLTTTMIAKQQDMMLSLSTSNPEEAELMEAVFKRAHDLMGLTKQHIEVIRPVDNVACIAQARQRAEYAEPQAMVSHG